MKTDKDKMEAIGNVVMNYNYYSGKDYYSEGISEDILLEFVKKYPESEYDHIIQNTRSWSVMYHLSHVRENIASWLPIKKSDTVLEIGSGCGAITGCLAELSKKVTCIELSKKRSLINANRHKELDNIEIIVGNFEDIEKELTEQYDYITLIGVLEYAESYINSDDPYHEFLKRVGSHLKPGGRLIIAIENKLGLKYFAGCKEDHTGRFFEGVEGYPTTTGVKTFSRNGLKTLLAESGYNSRFYYPYPDYKLPHTIYSDEWLPGTGALNTNLRNFDADRVVMFDEERVFNTFIEEGKFTDFSNSFLVMATKDEVDKNQIMPVFTKYANERNRKYRIATIIYADGYGNNKTVKKLAMNKEANAHIDGIYVNYLSLAKNYENTGLKPNKCMGINTSDVNIPADNTDIANSAVTLEFLSGITMEDYLDELNKSKEYERMLLLMREYSSVIKSISKEEFKVEDSFLEMFGEAPDRSDVSASVTDLDMIFSNIVLDKGRKENGEWSILDYEWTFNFMIPSRFIIYRALFYYLKDRKDSGFIKYINKRGLNLYEEFGIDEDEVKCFERMEHNFQIYIINGVASLEVMHELMPVKTLDLNAAIEDEFYLRELNRPKLYFGTGEGFSPDKQLQMFANVSDTNQVELDIPLTKDMTELRIDPTEYPCILKLKESALELSDGSIVAMDRFLTNGYAGSATTLLFDTDDGQIQFYNLPKEEKILHLKYGISMVEQGFFDELKDMFIEKMNRNKRELTVMDKVLVKCRLKEVEVIPQGLWYNVEKEND